MKPKAYTKPQTGYKAPVKKQVKQETSSSDDDQQDNPNSFTGWKQLDVALTTNAIVTRLPSNFEGCTLGDMLLIKKIGLKMGRGKPTAYKHCTWYFISYDPVEQLLCYCTVHPWSMRAMVGGDKYHTFKIGEQYEIAPMIDFNQSYIIGISEEDFKQRAKQIKTNVPLKPK